MISYQVLHPVLHSPRRCAKPPFLGVSECKYGVRTPDRALTITVFTDIGAVGTVIFLCVNMRFLTIEPEITMNCKDEVTCREIGRELVADWSQGNK